MKLVTLVENSCGAENCIAEHGLSIYIETEKHKLLLDTGQTDAVVKNVLTITEVSAITGYTPYAVDRWVVKGSLRSVIVQTGIITCRDWLIDFYCGD